MLRVQCPPAHSGVRRTSHNLVGYDKLESVVARWMGTKFHGWLVLSVIVW